VYLARAVGVLVGDAQAAVLIEAARVKRTTGPQEHDVRIAALHLRSECVGRVTKECRKHERKDERSGTT
jgi:hypothetical protein